MADTNAIIESLPGSQVNPCTYFDAGFNYSLPCRSGGATELSTVCNNGAPTDVPVTLLIKGCAVITEKCTASPGSQIEFQNFTMSRDVKTGKNCFATNASYCTITRPDPRNALSCCLGRIDDVNKPVACGGLYCPETCKNLKSVEEYCRRGNNLISSICAPFCPVDNVAARATWCDDAYTKFCQSSLGKGETVCRCFNSPLNQQPQPAASPLCFDPVCVVSGYKTADGQKIAETCRSTICQETVQCIRVGNCNINNNEFREVCGEAPPDGNGGTSFFFRTFLGLPVWLWLVIGGLLIIFVILLIYYFLS